MHLATLLPLSLLILTVAGLPTATENIKREASPTQGSYAAVISEMAEKADIQQFNSFASLIANGPDPNGLGNEG
ncbi:MAG: hypothetical protein ALECFALPRED_007992 [Alectoria fallacina]|uniref:FAS1 domain-containing protein n=1 Tax=Alectoria fallacina TaxID=1903189 RepID=A0A8H3J1T5_9LECA|nr:MAG: hypothetical protein ALECFALPRED_007992 [Alectoria fallacina]